MLIPTLGQLLQIPYGDGTTLDEVPTLDDLLARPYTGGSPSTKGLVGAEYRSEIRSYGEPLDWLRALESNSPLANRQGRIFVEQPLAGDERAYIYRNTRTIQTEEFGELAAGTMMLAWMQDEIFPVRDDRFRAPWQTYQAREVLTPSQEVIRPLNHTYRIDTNAVYVNDERVSPVNYALVSGGLMWINGYLPTTDAVVLYGYRPVYELLADQLIQGPMGQDGVRLPSRAPLRLLVEE